MTNGAQVSYHLRPGKPPDGILAFCRDHADLWGVLAVAERRIFGSTGCGRDERL